MKISAKEEYGLRILLQVAKQNSPEGLSIAQLSDAEGLSTSYAAKITRTLRLGGYIQSTPGPKGGYVLATPPDKIYISELLKALDGALYDHSFCEGHSGQNSLCTNSVDCSARSLWRIIQVAIDRVLDQVTLLHLMGDEFDASNTLNKILEKQILQSTILDLPISSDQ